MLDRDLFQFFLKSCPLMVGLGRGACERWSSFAMASQLTSQSNVDWGSNLMS